MLSNRHTQTAWAICAALLWSCSKPPPPRPDFGCDRLPWPNIVPLCKKIEGALVYTRGGHGLIRGNLDYYCDPQTVEDVYCSGTPIDLEQLHAAAAFGRSERQHELNMDTRLYVCLLWLESAAEQERLPPAQRDPVETVTCPARSTPSIR